MIASPWALQLDKDDLEVAMAAFEQADAHLGDSRSFRKGFQSLFVLDTMGRWRLALDAIIGARKHDPSGPVPSTAFSKSPKNDIDEYVNSEFEVQGQQNAVLP
ncbi:hypothetical protein NDU88_000891 [Pleurodeles waltl]|uniref:Uncharacterized protein n=1 Tax=Pleurodeles waltl TaxID=8319 RepID=A0AAV7S799_PLEWA|nr:hypothetical protein NDU88_000891 [Pleurodeles waltl]